jgi:hypothetical protein
VLSVSVGAIQLGTVASAGAGWQLSSVVDSTTGQLGITLYSLTPISSATGGSLVTIDFHVQPGVSLSMPPVQLVAAVDLNGRVQRTALYDSQRPLTLHTALPDAADAGSSSLVVAAAETAGVPGGTAESAPPATVVPISWMDGSEALTVDDGPLAGPVVRVSDVRITSDELGTGGTVRSDSIPAGTSAAGSGGPVANGTSLGAARPAAPVWIAAGELGFQTEIGTLAVGALAEFLFGVPAGPVPFGIALGGESLAPGRMPDQVFQMVDQVFLDQGVGEPVDWLLGESVVEQGLARVLVGPSHSVPGAVNPFDGDRAGTGCTEPPGLAMVGEPALRDPRPDPIDLSAMGPMQWGPDDFGSGLVAALDAYFAQAGVGDDGLANSAATGPA